MEWGVKCFQAKGKSPFAVALKWKGVLHVERKRRKARVAGTEKARGEVADQKDDHIGPQKLLRLLVFIPRVMGSN